ncbi:MAG: PAS domain S-box protein [Geminocystis sp. GBBB08]|nr:PAS domain S-box protein [Geminocystis sp. GBBB08]
MDVTQQKKTEQSLKIAEENYRSIFENALEGIFQSTPEGHYLNVNPAMAKIYGYDSPEEMINNVKHISQQIYVDSQKRKEFKFLLEKQDYIKDFEYQIYLKDRQIIWLEENTRAVRDNEGNLLYYEGIVQDITQRKIKEKMLQKQIEELRISIDENKKQQEVKSIIESDYFQELKANVHQLRINS